MLRAACNMVKKRPVLCSFEVTTRCNADCKYCGVDKKKARATDELGLDEIRRIFTGLKKFGIFYVLLHGGEPLVKEDLFDVIDLIKSMKFRVGLVTNGTLLDEETAKKLSERRVTLEVSLDTLDREKYKQIRGVDMLDTVLGNIRTATKYRRKLWALHAVVSEANHNEIRSLQEFARGLGWRFTALPYIYESGERGRRYDSLVPTKEHATGAFEQLLKSERNQLMRGAYRDVLKYLRGEDIGPCDANRHSMVLGYTGEFLPCLELPSIGNLRQMDVEDVWEKRDMSRVKNCYKQTPCYYGCSRAVGCVLRHKLIF